MVIQKFYKMAASQLDQARADQNMGSVLLEFSMRTAMHGTSRVSFAIFVCPLN